MRVFLITLWATAALVEGYQILCVFPMPSPSHNILGKGIVTALLRAGHSVWWATPYPEIVKPTANLTMIDVSATRALFKNPSISDLRSLLHTVALSAELATLAAQAPEMVRAMQQERFDAVITEWFISDLPAGYAAVQQVPWILFSSMVFHPVLEHLVDEVTSTAILPVHINDARVPMDYWQRVLNSIVVEVLEVAGWVARVFYANHFINLFGAMAANRGTVLPALSAVYNNVSVLLVNSHPVLAPAQSLPPNVVDIGGYHIVENSSLPEDLKDLLDSSTKGFIYFSLGSVVQMSILPPSLKADLVQMLQELHYTVLWKSDQLLTGLPKNIHVRSWFPQSGILAHPNIKLFITHGGILSTIEAVHYGVPLLVVPVFGDQPMNADRAAETGYAVKVDFHAGMAQELRAGLRKMMSNDSYYNTVKHLSKLFHNRPVAPSKLISHYVELAIESKGAYHLRSSARHYPWWQRRRLDQLFGCILFFYSLYIALGITARELRRAFIKRKKD